MPYQVNKKATSIKLLYLDDISGLLKLEVWLYNVSLFYTQLLRRHHFVRNLGEQAPIHQELFTGGPILLAI